MSTYRRYQEARDAAWRTLLHFDVKALPVDPQAMARKMGLAVLPFPDAREAPRLAGLISRAGEAPCVSLRIRGAWQVFFRPNCLDERETRFALAHELGHLVLRHGTYALAPGVRAFQGSENAGDLLEDPQTLDDYAADIFAIRLLAPACVLHALRIDTPGGVAEVCELPPRASALRAERMELLAQRDAFFIHPLEKQVWIRFQPFLQAKRVPSASALPDFTNTAPPEGDARATAPRSGPSTADEERGGWLRRLLARWRKALWLLLRKLPFFRKRLF